jgi:hypothetical protein
MGFTEEEVGSDIIVSYDFPVDSGELRDIRPDSYLTLNDVVIDNVEEIEVTDSVSDLITRADIKLSSLLNYSLFVQSPTNIIKIFMGYNGQYVEVYRGVITKRGAVENYKSSNFTVESHDKLVLLGHPFFQQYLYNKTWDYSVRASSVVSYCLSLAGLSCAYNTIDWNLYNYDTNGKYPIDVIRELLEKSYSQIQIIGDIARVYPKAPPKGARPVITFRDSNDIINLSEDYDEGNYFNRVRVIGSSGIGIDGSTNNSGGLKIVDYTPASFASLIKPNNIPTINGLDPDTYKSEYNTWMNNNKNTLGSSSIGESVTFQNSKFKLPMAKRKAPADPYTDDPPEKLFFEDTFTNTGITIDPETIKVYGGKMSKNATDNFDYTGAEYVVGSMINSSSAGKIKIPYDYIENPSYQPVYKDNNGVIGSQDLYIQVTSTTGTGDAEVVTPIQDAVTKLEFDFAGTCKWHFLRSRKASRDVIRMWADDATAAEMADIYVFPPAVQPTSTKSYIDVTLQTIDGNPGGTLLYPQPPDPTLTNYPYQSEPVATDTDGKCVFKRIPISNYKATVTKSSYTQEDIANDKWTVNTWLSEFNLESSNSNKSTTKKYVIQDTEYNWLVTANTLPNPFGPPYPYGLDDKISLIVDNPTEISNVDRIVEPKQAIEDPIITDRQIAYYVGSNFLDWSVGSRTSVPIKIPSVPMVLRGKTVRVVESRIDRDNSLYVIEHKRIYTKKSWMDTLSTWEFV